MDALRRFFRLDENRTTVWTEVRAGLVTFMAMAYIIFVQPIIMSAAPGLRGPEALGAIMPATRWTREVSTVVFVSSFLFLCLYVLRTLYMAH